MIVVAPPKPSKLLAGCVRALLLLEPVDKLIDACLEVGTRIIAQKPAGFAYIGESDGNVARLHRPMLDEGALAETPLEELNDSAKLDCLRLAKVEYLKPALIVLHGGDHSGDDVVDVSVVALCRAVAEDRNWLFPGYQPCELMNGQIGPLSGAVDREESKANNPQIVQMAINTASGFSCDLCCS